jgi:hypothetical protein
MQFINSKYTNGKDKIYSNYDAFVCIPMTIDKKPAISWKGISETPKDIFKSGHNIALLTGKINQITVIDIDIPKKDKVERDGMKQYEELLEKYNQGNALNIPTCQTQSKGLHLYFKYDESVKTTTGVNGYSIDIRNDGALIIAPPSIGEKGIYQWKDEKTVYGTELIDIPVWLKEWLELSSKKNVKKEKPIRENKLSVINKDHIFIYDVEDIILLLKKLPKKYLNNYDDWFVITSCLKSENLYDVWNKWSSKSKTYDSDSNDEIWESLEPLLNINYLMIIAQKENIEIGNIIRKTKKLNFLTFKPHIQINEKYVKSEHFNNVKLPVRTQILKSNCGTGKTTLSAEYIRSLIKNAGYKVLSITPRVSLAYQQIKNFKDNNITMQIYKDLDKKSLNSVDNLIIQVDSICKLDIGHWYNTIIYLDEISALISYVLTSSTLDGKRVIIFNQLLSLLKQASYILCTDADVNDMVIKFFDKIGIKYHMIENTYKNIIDVNATEYDDKEIIIKQMEEMLSDNKKIICCFDSKDEMEIIVQRLKKYCSDNKLKNQINNFVVYSSEEGDEDDFLHINEKWKSKNIFFTPKITIGVSFDNKEPRDVFMIAMGNSINSIGFIQQISRCRNISQLHYYVIKRYQYLKYDSVADVRENYRQILDTYHTNENVKEIFVNHGSDYDPLTGTWHLHDSLYNELYFFNEYYDHVLRSALREQFRWMLEAKGFTIVYNNDKIDVDELDDIKNDIEECKEIIEENRELMNHRALYDKPESLTSNEKKIHENAKRRAKFLNIDFNSKVIKKKYEEYLLDDKIFTQHYACRQLLGSDDKLDDKISRQLKKDYNIINAKCLLSKIKLIKQLEDVLDVKSLDIDTKRDMERFDEEVPIGDDLKESIKHAFRIKKDNDDTFKDWYYELIQMYKHIVGSNIFTFKRIKLNNNYHNKYITNIDILNNHKQLIKTQIRIFK